MAGKVDVCRVDTCLTYANGGLWAMVDGELFLPEEWFGAAFAQRRRELGIPAERRFETKIQLGLKMVKRVKAQGVPFDLLACDALWAGQASSSRFGGRNVQYAAQVLADTLVYLSEPPVGIPPKRAKRGRPRTRPECLGQGYEVRALAQHPQTTWQQVQVRHTERGRLIADFAVRHVWTVAAGQRPRTEWLVIRRNSEATAPIRCSMPPRTPPGTPDRVELPPLLHRAHFEDAKTEIGWDDSRPRSIGRGSITWPSQLRHCGL